MVARPELGPPSGLDPGVAFGAGLDSRPLLESGRQVCFRYATADPDVLSVHLDCDGAVPGPRALTRRGRQWSLDFKMPPMAQLARLEYRFQMRGPEQDLLVLDPTNPTVVPTVFGERSVLEAPSYHPPWWLTARAFPGHLNPFLLPGETEDPIPVTVWEPHGFGPADPLPLLLVHDGPEYDQLARITRYSGALIAKGILPPHRLALAHPVLRDAWYSGSPQYLRTISCLGLVRIRQLYAVRSPVVVMGASLGGLTSLLAGLLGDSSIGGVFSQSGSFFQVRTDGQETDFRYFPRIVDRVREILHLRHPERVLRIGMTCGVLEENAANNRVMAAALARAGHAVTHAEVPDLHNYTAWRDALDPHLTAVLLDLWT